MNRGMLPPTRPIQSSGTSSGGWASQIDMQSGSPAAQNALQCVFPVAEYYTVRFGIAPTNAPGELPFVATAVVTWNLCGISIQRRMTVTDGAVISGTGQGVTVNLIDASAGVTAGLKYKTTVQVSPGARPTTGNPPTLFTDAQQSILPGASFDFNVPADSGIQSVAFYTASGKVGGGPVNILAKTNSTEWQINEGFSKFMPLTSDSPVRITNLDAADTMHVRPVWGVEG